MKLTKSDLEFIESLFMEVPHSRLSNRLSRNWNKIQQQILQAQKIIDELKRQTKLKLVEWDEDLTVVDNYHLTQKYVERLHKILNHATKGADCK